MTEPTTNQNSAADTASTETVEKYKEFLQWAADFCESNDIFKNDSIVTHPLLGRMPIHTGPSSEKKLNMIGKLAESIYDIWTDSNGIQDGQFATFEEMRVARGLYVLELDRHSPPILWTPGQKS